MSEVLTLLLILSVALLGYLVGGNQERTNWCKAKYIEHRIAEACQDSPDWMDHE